MKLKISAVLFAPLLFSACADAALPEEARTESELIAPCDPVDLDLSLVIHDRPTLTAADFSLRRTIAAIRTTSGGAATTNALLLNTITSGLALQSTTQPESGLPLPLSPRNAEAALTGSQLLNEMQPIALFNRFDLAAADGTTCGEYRIIYGRYPNSTFQRYLLIFESALPNPTPQLGVEGCRPVAEFWHSLSDPALTVTQRAQRLATFYYSGGNGFSPVVTHANYGAPFGQIRANMFLQIPWQLREWRTSFNRSRQPVFVPDTVKDNPLAELYNETSSNPNAALFATEQAAFRGEFLDQRIMELLAPELNNTDTSACRVVFGTGAAFNTRFDEGQSVSQGNSDNPATIASNSFRNAITAELSAEPAFAGITNTQVLNRAGAMTCGGCHQFSNGVAIAPGVTWPASAGFVHANELGSSPPNVTPLSDLLTTCFLPARRTILENFVCAGSGNTSAAIDPSAVRVAAARSTLLNANESDAPAALAAFESAVLNARAIDRAKAGAFYEVRPPH